MQDVKPRSGVYVQNIAFFNALRKMLKDGLITRQELSTFRGQALNGDLEGAKKGLARLCAKRA